MFDRIPHLCDFVIPVIGAVIGLCTKMLMQVPAVMDNGNQMNALSWSLLPLIGSLLASGGAFMLNRTREQAEVVAGRAICACVGGVVLPKLLSKLHQSIEQAVLDPILVIGFGFSTGLLVYIWSKPLVEKLYSRGDAVADKAVAGLEDRLPFGKKPDNDGK